MMVADGSLRDREEAEDGANNTYPYPRVAALISKVCHKEWPTTHVRSTKEGRPTWELQNAVQVMVQVLIRCLQYTGPYWSVPLRSQRNNQ